MIETNKVFLKPGTLSARVETVLNYRNMSKDDLYEIITKHFGYNITKSNFRTSFDKNPNINFIMVLSKALNVTIEYLLGMEDDVLYESELDLDIKSRKYTKYNGEYFFYFFPTVANNHEKLCVAKLSISDGIVRMSIETETTTKKYYGKLQLSKSYVVGYINLVGNGFGEIVNLSFRDPTINTPETKVSMLIGGMLSISCGDFKRSPVYSRFILSDKKLEGKEEGIRANLLLNTKYITVEEENIKKVVNGLDLNGANNDIVDRLTSAFRKRTCYVIEESFIINTLQKDYALTLEQTMKLLDTIRLNSITDSNSKINKSLDARIYNYLYPQENIAK